MVRLRHATAAFRETQQAVDLLLGDQPAPSEPDAPDLARGQPALDGALAEPEPSGSLRDRQELAHATTVRL